ncbi:BglG family transcription antiterminator [Subtercola boreus]|uniref:Transcriptional antiterminator n=1 Tax=Subtercola boreus TaxID=120213 RepID=A0A3E0W8G8_9MICO|nr:BglG family transcription antiterminator [Subtercola boreus]RFA19431.1 transcriptional antiterminator [Subtercola boreus]RFA19692.1 transcriptional antiterminator [Subtercola boreus]RFA26058.1 transcriptional antiterminator [Subtercola boreus]
MSDRRQRLLDYLAENDGWTTSGQLADRLGVTTRSVRSYVTAAKSAAEPLDIIVSSAEGYRLNRDAYAAWVGQRSGDSGGDRLYRVVRQLNETPDGLDVHELASALFVSESTVEADLRKARPILDECGLTLRRQGSRVSVQGTEENRRRLVSRLFRAESARGFVEVERIQNEFGSVNLTAFKTDLLDLLGAGGYFVNEYGLDSVLLHVAIAVDRTLKDLVPTDAAATVPPQGELAPGILDLLDRHFAVTLSGADLEHLVMLLTTRVITPGHDLQAHEQTEQLGLTDDVAFVREVARRASERYLIDLDNDEFAVRLALHVRNLVARARVSSYSRNPMTRSIKTSYPMTYELAVFIASEIQRKESISINDDEIAYIALHVGSHLERQSRREEMVTCTLVFPNYYDIHLMMLRRLEAALGDEVRVDKIITRTDIDRAEIDTDLIITTVPALALGDSTVLVQTFLTDDDIDTIRRAVRRVRRQQRRRQLKDELLLYFSEELYVRNLSARDEVDMITQLGERMLAQGIIDEPYIAGAIERERMSSTAFTDTVAVPHSMLMSANRTAIAIAVNDHPMDWGENRVNVIALIAFSSSGRNSFQTIFDQFVEVFSERDEVQQLIRGSVSFSAFIEELVHLMDS